MKSEQQLNRVIMAKEIVKKAAIHKTKRALEILGDESVALSVAIVEELKKALSEIAQCKQEIEQLQRELKEFQQ